MPFRSLRRFGGIWFAVCASAPFVILFSLSGCGQKEPPNPYVGDMYDHSYSGQKTLMETKTRVNAQGAQVAIDQFDGSFVWADYAAPWCKPCAQQAPVIRELENANGKEVVFLTIMTSTSPSYGSGATQQTARDWAGRFQLNPEKVLAANLWHMTIPTHILYSPAGQTLYRSEGYMSRDQIQSTLAKYMQDWKEWNTSGKQARWMKY